MNRERLVTLSISEISVNAWVIAVVVGSVYIGISMYIRNRILEQENRELKVNIKTAYSTYYYFNLEGWKCNTT